MAEYKGGGQHGEAHLAYHCIGKGVYLEGGSPEYSCLLGASSWPTAHDSHGQWTG